MRFIFFLIVLCSCETNSIEPPISFKDALKITKEVVIRDSLLIDCSLINKKPIDSTTGKKYWEIIYNSEKWMIYNAEYFIAGKITSHPKINILLFFIERASNPISKSEGISQELFFIILDKRGNFKNKHTISSYLEIKRNNDTLDIEKINAWLYKDFRIMQSEYIDPRFEKYSYPQNYTFDKNGNFTSHVTLKE
jgi:hypothetical protein